MEIIGRLVDKIGKKMSIQWKTIAQWEQFTNPSY